MYPMRLNQRCCCIKHCVAHLESPLNIISCFSGWRLAAVSDKLGKSKRTLFAALGVELCGSSEKELVQKLLLLLKHLPLMATAH